MAQPSQLIQHIESYVDASRSPPQQVAGLERIVSLLKNDVLTVESLVREMEMYLTTTDNIIRARGILLLGDVLTGLSSKPLDSTTIHTMLNFFTERLADWRALRGALVGCLALMRRKSNGVVTSVDAKAVAKSYLQNLQVQSLGQHDRKLCFELLECLLECCPDTVASLGEELTYGICEAVDGEKDPHCLMLTFHIVEVLVQLFPYPSDPIASYAGDLFGILACYFPIHFTHQNVEDFDVKREDLSRALMLAFSSTPLFEPFAMPLLLEKLSSSLTSAKVDSLKYLNHCASKYGTDRMAKHAAAIWSSLKDAIYPSGEEPVLFFTSESVDGSQENEIAREALALLEKLIIQNSNLSLSLMFGDEEINMVFNTITCYKNYEELSLQSKQKLHVLGRILYVSVKASATSCNRVFERFFPPLMEALGISVENENEPSSCNDNYTISARPNFGSLYLCIELLGACRDLIAGSQFLTSQCISANETWYRLLRGYSTSLSKTFCSVFSASTSRHAEVMDMHLGVKGLQILATFPGGYSIISKSTCDSILNTFVSIVTLDFDKTSLWKLALKALVYIGSSIHGCNESEKSASYMDIVVERILSLLSDDCRIPFPLKLEAISQIGTSGMTYMLNIVLVLGEVICVNMAEVYAQGNVKSGKMVLQLLECYSNDFLPWIQKYESFEQQALMRFVINIWNQIENCRDFYVGDLDKKLLDATMKVMKLAVACCSVEGQSIVMDKANTVLSSSACLPLKKSLSTLEPTEEVGYFSDRDEWILSLFSSVIIALRPQTHVPSIRSVLHMLMSAFLNGNVSAAQALGSLVNKLDIKPKERGVAGDCTFEDLMDMICSMDLLRSCNNGSSGNCDNTSNGNEMGITNLYLGAAKTGMFQIHAIIGLAWIAKGLLMRGHEKVKDLTMVFLECLVSFERTATFPMHSLDQDIQLSTMKCAADAFQILMCDSELCLNRKFHATIRPLYKQRFFSTVMPILQSLIIKPGSSLSRSMLHRVIAHVISDTPLVVILNDAKKLIPVVLDGLTLLAKDILDKDILYSLLLVLSGILTNKTGQEAVTENAYIIINCLVGLITYPHMMVVRETTIQCLSAMSELPYARIYPMRLQVVQAVSKALDDPRRNVRQEAVKCRQAWASMSSRSLRY